VFFLDDNLTWASALVSSQRASEIYKSEYLQKSGEIKFDRRKKFQFLGEKESYQSAIEKGGEKGEEPKTPRSDLMHGKTEKGGGKLSCRKETLKQGGKENIERTPIAYTKDRGVGGRQRC